NRSHWSTSKTPSYTKSVSWQHHLNRVGLFYGYDFQNGLSVSLEYAFEWQDHDEGDSDKFHYAGVGVNYSF
ncbi:OmpG family monomeric porin, partial [Escherichia coli]|uniref:OmpG family monomeric porin n=1 Tax=Escherichia coli TaxID=562 RepID=UPI001CDA325D